MRNICARRASILLIWITAACGGGGTGPDNGVAAIVLTPATLDTLFSLGDTVRVTASPRDASGAEVPGATVTFQVTPDNVASVSTSGLITALDDGSATMTASSGGANAQVVVRVRQKLADLVAPATASVAVDRTTAIAAIPSDARGNAIGGLTLQFSSSDMAVATVSASGVVTGEAVGTATITSSVTSPADGTQNATTDVTVTAGPPLTATVTLGANFFQPDTVTIAVNGTVTWSNGSGITHDVDFGTATRKILAWDAGERSLSFPTAGTHNYHCNLHTGMEAVVVVQ